MRIICFGDSNTYGYDPRACSGGRYPAQDRWVDILSEKLGIKLRNRGENGRQIPYLPQKIAQVERMLSANAPVDIFAVMLGTNDLLQGATAREAAARMETFLIPVLVYCKRVLLIAPPPMKHGQWVTEESLRRESARLGTAYRELSRRLKIDFADAGDWNVEMAFDGVHFTEDGNRTFAEGLSNFLKP